MNMHALLASRPNVVDALGVNGASFSQLHKDVGCDVSYSN